MSANINDTSKNNYTKLYSLLNDIQDDGVQESIVIKGGSKTSLSKTPSSKTSSSKKKTTSKKPASSKLPPFKISSPDPYQKFLAIHIKNYPQSKFLENLHKNIDQLNSKEDIQEYIDQNFVFY